ncbi:aminopeptidase [Corynebacterium sp.]|uniref:aminopeptidase n=1 Tax=Corynebacterium sp. TaxID=1720 RepID=UPI0025C34A3F|nr:aminopeptidase [Corynebacterium sp.]
MKKIPNLPRPVPEITVGDTVTGSDVIDCRVVRASAGDTAAEPRADLADDGVWEVRVPDTASPLTDLAELAEEPRLAEDGWRAAAAVLVRRLGALVDGHPVRSKRHTVQIRVPEGTTVHNLRNLCQGVVLGGRHLVVSRKDPATDVRSVHLDLSDLTDDAVVQRADDAVHRGRVLGAATVLARDINAVPVPTATSVWWRRKAKAVLGDVPGTRVKTHGRGWLQRKGFGGILATATAGAGVNDPAGEDEVGFVEMFWDPAAAEGDLTDDRPDVLLVGGAPVPAVIRALAELKGPRKVVGLVPVHGYSPPVSVPGRARAVVEHVDGTTSQVPAVGSAVARAEICRRLALADAVAWGVQRHRPRRVVVVGPVSTASKTALGELTGAVSGDEQAVRRVTLRGAKVGERWWPLPAPSYLEKNVSARDADLTVAPEGPGALTAAMYLRRFADGVPCTVLDTTGPSWSDSVHGDMGRGSTGFAARTLVEWFRK